jgi:hypothetical protein
MLGVLASVDLTPREEMIFAASYVEQVRVPAEYFSEKTYKRYEQIAIFLLGIPTAWALEICNASLLRARTLMEQEGFDNAD